MATFLLEIGCEEIPARMQHQAQADLVRLLKNGFTKHGIATDLKVHVTPRRLVAGGTLQSATSEIQEIRGPRIDAAASAIQGFLKSQNLKSLDSCFQLETPKGTFWAIKRTQETLPLSQVFQEVVQSIFHDFPWPKKMLWGENPLHWVRPIRRLILLVDGSLVSFSIGKDQWKIETQSTSMGHWRLNPKTMEVPATLDAFEDLLEKHNVLLSSDKRKTQLQNDLAQITQAQGVEIPILEELLEENAGLTEWPQALYIPLDPAFLRLPPSVIEIVARVHQRYFLAYKHKKPVGFVVVTDGFFPKSEEIIKGGNQRVVAARLRDALFFLDTDQKAPLEEHLEPLKKRIYYAGLGSVYDKALRLEKTCGELAALFGLRSEEAARAGLLAKADLGSQMIGEFAELQGQMGHLYASSTESMEVAQAIGEHYFPQGPHTPLPESPLGALVATADKADALVGFLGLNLLPSGSKDPFALRRAALGLLRLGLAYPFDLRHVLKAAYSAYALEPTWGEIWDRLEPFLAERFEGLLEPNLKPFFMALRKTAEDHIQWTQNLPETLELLKAQEALSHDPTFQTLETAEHRLTHIFDAHKKSPSLDVSLLTLPEEKALLDVLLKVQTSLENHPKHSSLSKRWEHHRTSCLPLVEPLHRFFDNVLINDPIQGPHRQALCGDVLSVLQAPFR